MTRPPIPRHVVLWTYGPATAREGGTTAPFVYTTSSTDTERRLIRDAVLAQRDWHDESLAWITRNGYTYGEWMQAREAAQGLTPSQCAAVIIVDGHATPVTERDLADPPPPWLGTPSRPPSRPDRHSTRASVTPETHEPSQEVK